MAKKMKETYRVYPPPLSQNWPLLSLEPKKDNIKRDLNLKPEKQTKTGPPETERERESNNGERRRCFGEEEEQIQPEEDESQERFRRRFLSHRRYHCRQEAPPDWQTQHVSGLFISLSLSLSTRPLKIEKMEVY